MGSRCVLQCCTAAVQYAMTLWHNKRRRVVAGWARVRGDRLLISGVEEETTRPRLAVVALFTQLWPWLSPGYFRVDAPTQDVQGRLLRASGM